MDAYTASVIGVATGCVEIITATSGLLPLPEPSGSLPRPSGWAVGAIITAGAFGASAATVVAIGFTIVGALGAGLFIVETAVGAIAVDAAYREQEMNPVIV